MKNSEIWAQYKSYTVDITQYSRNLGFAGAAICWILKTPEGVLSAPVLFALAFFVAFFVSDMLQSLLGAVLLRKWMHKEESQRWRDTKSLEGEYLKPRWLDYPSFALFIIKVIFLLCGFVFLGKEILSKTLLVH